MTAKVMLFIGLDKSAAVLSVLSPLFYIIHFQTG